MSDISPYTQEIQNAVYGEQVRSSIINALNKVNDDNNSYSQIKTDILNAKSAVDAQVESFDGKVENAQTTLNSLQSKVSEANTAKTNLTNATNTANTAKNNLTSATNSANTAKTNLQTATTNANTAIANANTAKSNLETATTNANTAKTDVTSATTNANTAKSALNTSIQSANTANSNLENTISSANTAKNNLQTVINSSGTAKSNLSDVIVQAGTSQTNLEGAITNANTSHSQLVEENATAKKNIEDLRSENFDAQEVLTGLLKVYPTETVEGNPASFIDGADNIPIKSLKVNITPIQDGSGDPSPTNIRPISGFDSVKVTRMGRNLFAGFNDGSRSFETGITVTFSDTFHVSITGTTNGTNIDTPTKTIGGDNETPIIFEKGKTYVVSLNGKINLSGSNKIRLILQTDTTLKWYGDTTNGVWVITPSDDLVINRLRFRFQTSGTVVDIDADFQIEEGTEKTEFQPFNRSVLDISIPTEAGTVYGGTLDVVKGELVVDKLSVTIDGSESEWSNTNNYNTIYSVVFHNMDNAPITSSYDVITNLGFVPCRYNYTEMETNTYAISLRNNEDGKWRLYFRTPNTTIADLKSFFASHNLQVVYPLATPIVYTLTPQQVTSVLGKNNVWSDAGSVDIEYRTDIKLYIEKRLAELTA